MSQVTVVPVTKNAEMRAFVNFPWKIYANYPNWVPPLKKAVSRLLDTDKHPYWKFSERILFLAKRGSEIVGRIAGIIDNHYNEFHREKMAGWGFFECEDNAQTAEALFHAVEQWVRSKGMEFLRGPLNPSTNYEVGLLIEGFEYPPVVMMTYNPRYYISLVESYGFEKEKDLLALVLKEVGDRGKRSILERLAQRIKEKGNVWIRNARLDDFHAELALIKEIYDAAWKPNWGFVPMSDDEIIEMAGELVRIIDPDLVFFVYYDDDPVGFCLIVPDINPLLKRLNGKIGLLGLLKIPLYKKEIVGLRGLLFGFKQTHQRLGLPLVAFEHLNRLRRQKTQYQYLEFGWNLEDNHDINQFEMDIGAKPAKRYRIYRKSLV